MKLIIPTLILLIGFSPQAFSQMVRGKVTDQLNSPLIGVHVTNPSAGKGITTDIDGNFVIPGNPGDTLNFSFIGFLSTVYIVKNNQNQIRIELDIDTYRLRMFTVEADRIAHELHRMPSKEEYLESVRLGSFLLDNELLAPKATFTRKAYNDKYQKQKNALPGIIEKEQKLKQYYNLQEDEEYISELIKIYPQVENDLDPAMRDYVKDFLEVIYSSPMDQVKASFLLFLGDRYRN